MLLTAFLMGIAIGFSIAAPVGPIGILCIRRTIIQGRLFGLLSGLGSATADAIYGCIAGLGLTIISNFLMDQSNWFQLLGGLFLCYLGIRTYFSSPARDTNARIDGSRLGSYISAFFLTITNPLTILSFIAVFSGLGLTESNHDIFSRLIIVLGVFCGSLLWWLILCNGVGLLINKMQIDRYLLWINRISGVILFIFGGIALVTLLVNV